MFKVEKYTPVRGQLPDSSVWSSVTDPELVTLVDGVRGWEDVIREESFDVDGVEVAAVAAIFADDLNAALLGQSITGLFFAKHLEDIFCFSRRTAAAKIDRARFMNADIIFGEQFADQANARFAGKIFRRKCCDEELQSIPVIFINRLAWHPLEKNATRNFVIRHQHDVARHLNGPGKIVFETRRE